MGTLQAPMAHTVYELAGPQVYTYRELLQTIAAQAGREPLLVPLFRTVAGDRICLRIAAPPADYCKSG
jgi:uncharacterized protein YbjT (DUF2867 family)